MGPGISSYFKLLKALAWLFLIWTVLTIPMVTLVTFGTRDSSFADTPFLAELTLGQVSALARPGSHLFLPVFRSRAVVPGPPGALCFARPDERVCVCRPVRAQLGDDLNVTSVEIIGTNCAPEGSASAPCTITKLEAAQIFTGADLFAVMIFAAAYVWIRVMEKRESAVVDLQHITVQDYTAMIPSVPPFTKPEHVRAHFESLRGSPAIADVQVAEDDAELLRIFVKRGRLIKRVTDLTEQQAKARACSQDRQEARLLVRRTRLKAKIKKLNKKARAVKANDRALAAFVTFERHKDFVQTVKLYRGRRFFVCCDDGLDMPVPQARKRGKRRLGAAMEAIASTAGALSAAVSGSPAASDIEIRTVPARIKVKAAPAPSTIMWHNLHIEWRSRMLRRSVTATLSVVLLALSIVVGFVASVQQATAVGATEGVCDEDLTQEQLKTAAVAAGAGSPDAACYCGYLSRADAVTLAGVARSLCSPWATDVLLATVATVGAAAAVPVVNGVFRILLKRMAEWEAHHSINSQAESFAQRLFLLTVINTAALPLLINAAIPGLEALPGNKFDDFVPTWYSTVGVQLTITMLINVVGPHVSPILKYFAILLFRRGHCDQRCGVACLGDPGKRAASQRQLNSWFEGPQFRLDTRYAAVMQTVFVTLLFASMLPLLVPIAFVNLVVSFYVDKWLLLRFYRTPPHYDVHLGRALTSWIPWALFMHLAMAAYAMSTPQIFSSDVTDSKVVSDVSGVAKALGSQVAGVVDRLSQAHVLALTIAALVCVGILLLSKCVGGMTRLFVSALAIISCGSCDFQSKEELEPACAKMPFSRARDEDALEGIKSYSLMQNPDIAKALAIAPDVARHKTRVVELRDELPDDLPDAADAGDYHGSAGGAASAAEPSVPRPPPSPPSLPEAGATAPRPSILIDEDDHVAGSIDEKGLGGKPRHRLTDTARERVLGTPRTAQGWVDAVGGRRARMEEAEAEAAEDSRLLGAEFSSRMLAAWKRGEDQAAHANGGRTEGGHQDFDFDDASSEDDEEPHRYEDDALGESDDDSIGEQAVSGAGVGQRQEYTDRAASGAWASASPAMPRTRSGMEVFAGEDLPRTRSGMAVASAASMPRTRSGMAVASPLLQERHAGARPAPPVLEAGHFIDLDEDSDEDDPDWDVDDDQPVRWTGEGGILRQHSDADHGQWDA